jgi:CRP/FNR family transcriptional regulator, cyclic AMP receptor protein
MMRGPKGPYNLGVIQSCLGCVMREQGLFCHLPQGALNTLNSIRQAAYFPRGAVLFMEGETPRGLYVLCIGHVKLTVNSPDGHSLTLRNVEPGEVIGLSSVVGNHPYEATAETLAPCQVSFIPRLEFLRFLRSNADVSIRVAKHLSMEVHQAWRQSRMVALAPDTQAKLAQFLIEQARKREGDSGDGIRIALNMTHEEIAKNIGASRESVTRILKNMRNRGLIAVRGGMITIIHAVELANLLTSA